MTLKTASGLASLLLSTALLYATPAPAQAAADPTRLGTTVIGEQDAAIGLFVNPWKEQDASTTDRPPRLFDMPLTPLDSQGFRQSVDARQNLGVERLQRLHR